MKAKDACRILGISNVTLADYVKKGYVQAIKLPSGRYRYEEASIYAFLNKVVDRKKLHLYTTIDTKR